MATVGLSKLWCAKYNYDPETDTVSYTDGFSPGKYTEVAMELEGSEDNDFYADNNVDESDKTFSGGNVNTTTNDLLPDKMVPLLGVRLEPMDDGPDGAAWVVFDEAQEAPDVGQGGVLKKKINGKFKYLGLIFTRIQYANPGISAVTQGKTIEWQTQSLSATIKRSEGPGGRWFQISTPFDTEALAEAAVKKFLGIAGA